MVVRLSALRTGRFLPQKIFLALISVRGWVDPRAIVRSEGLCQWKIPITPTGIDKATVRIVAQHLNHWATTVSLAILNTFLKNIRKLAYRSRFRTKLNPRQHGFIKYKSTATNLVVYLDFITPLVHPQSQVNDIYFDFSNTFDLLPHALLLPKLYDFGLPLLTLPGSTVAWQTDYPTFSVDKKKPTRCHFFYSLFLF